MDKGEGNSKGKFLVSKVEKKHLRRETGGTQSVKREQRGKPLQDLKLQKCSGPSASPNKSCQRKGSLDPIIYHMMQNLKEVAKRRESMSSSTVEEVLVKHNMSQMKEKLDLIRDCMEEVQKDPQNSDVLKASVTKFEGALLPSHQYSERKRIKHEYSHRPYPDWGELAAARRRNSVDLATRSVVPPGEGLQPQKEEEGGTLGASVKKYPSEFEDDEGDLSDDEGMKETESQNIVEEFVAEILNRVGQSCSS